MLARMGEQAEIPGYPIPLVDRAGRAYEIRPYAAADREALEAFYAEFEPKRAAQGLPPEGTERIRRWLDDILGAGLHLVGRREGVLMGHALIVHAPEPGTGEYAVFLRAADRGKGVGSEMNRAAVAVARAAGMRRLWLTVRPHNRPAIRSYERVGFRFRPATIYSTEAEMELDLGAP